MVEPSPNPDPLAPPPGTGPPPRAGDESPVSPPADAPAKGPVRSQSRRRNKRIGHDSAPRPIDRPCLLCGASNAILEHPKSLRPSSVVPVLLAALMIVGVLIVRHGIWLLLFIPIGSAFRSVRARVALCDPCNQDWEQANVTYRRGFWGILLAALAIAVAAFTAPTHQRPIGVAAVAVFVVWILWGLLFRIWIVKSRQAMLVQRQGKDVLLQLPGRRRVRLTPLGEVQAV